MLDNEIEAALKAWLLAIPAHERTVRGQWLVSRLWTLHRELAHAGQPRDPNRSRKRRRCQKDLQLVLAWRDDNNGLQTAWRDRCLTRMAKIATSEGYAAHALYMHFAASRQRPEWYALFQTPDAAWLTLAPQVYEPSPITQPGAMCTHIARDFVSLYATLSLPRVPVPFAIDEACLLTEF